MLGCRAVGLRCRLARRLDRGLGCIALLGITLMCRRGLRPEIIALVGRIGLLRLACRRSRSLGHGLGRGSWRIGLELGGIRRPRGPVCAISRLRRRCHLTLLRRILVILTAIAALSSLCAIRGFLGCAHLRGGSCGLGVARLCRLTVTRCRLGVAALRRVTRALGVRLRLTPLVLGRLRLRWRGWPTEWLTLITVHRRHMAYPSKLNRWNPASSVLRIASLSHRVGGLDAENLQDRSLSPALSLPRAPTALLSQPRHLSG